MRKGTSARSSWRAEHSVLVAAIVTGAFFVYGQLEPSILFPLSNALPLVLAIIALVVALAALRKHRVKKMTGGDKLGLRIHWACSLCSSAL